MNDDAKAVAGIIAAVMAVVLFVGGLVVLDNVFWRVGWWYNIQNTNRQAHLIQQGYNFQSNLEQQISQGIGNVTTLSTQITEAAGNKDYQKSLEGQREGDVSTICQEASEVTTASVPMPPVSVQFVSANCLGGSISPSSKYYTVGG